MPRKSHENHTHIKNQSSQRGFISNDFKNETQKSSIFKRSSMKKSEKIIMGIFVGGIVIFLILSIVILFGKGSKKSDVVNVPNSSTTPAVKVITTPYPTIPPIADFLMQVNEKRFYPTKVNITKGHKVTIINIGSKATTITPTEKGNTYVFGEIGQGEEKSVMFDKPGIYRYTRTGKPDQILTITVSE